MKNIYLKIIMLFSVFAFFGLNSTYATINYSAYNIYNSMDNCNRIDEVVFPTGYKIMHKTLQVSLTKHIGRTELYKDGVLQEYQDYVFLKNSGVPNISGDACSQYSTITGIGYYETGELSSSIQKPLILIQISGMANLTVFDISKKNISNIQLVPSIFSSYENFHINLEMYTDITLSGNPAIVSTESVLKSFNNDTLSYLYNPRLWGVDGNDYHGCAYNGWCTITTEGCNISGYRSDETNFYADYGCTLKFVVNSNRLEQQMLAHMGAEIPWFSVFPYSGQETLTGSFTLPKSNYNICAISPSSCQAPVVATCSDGIKNQDEMGIDVGGICGIGVKILFDKNYLNLMSNGEGSYSLGDTIPNNVSSGSLATIQKIKIIDLSQKTYNIGLSMISSFIMITDPHSTLIKIGNKLMGVTTN